MSSHGKLGQEDPQSGRRGRAARCRTRQSRRTRRGRHQRIRMRLAGDIDVAVVEAQEVHPLEDRLELRQARALLGVHDGRRADRRAGSASTRRSIGHGASSSATARPSRGRWRNWPARPGRGSARRDCMTGAYVARRSRAPPRRRRAPCHLARGPRLVDAGARELSPATCSRVISPIRRPNCPRCWRSIVGCMSGRRNAASRGVTRCTVPRASTSSAPAPLGQQPPRARSRVERSQARPARSRAAGSPAPAARRGAPPRRRA